MCEHSCSEMWKLSNKTNVCECELTLIVLIAYLRHITNHKYTKAHISFIEISLSNILKNLRELRQPQERFAPKFKRNREKI